MIFEFWKVNEKLDTKLREFRKGYNKLNPSRQNLVKHWFTQRQFLKREFLDYRL